MLYRVIAPMGCGKKELLFRRLDKACRSGERVFLIVPEQATAHYERRVLTLCGSRLGERVEVTNFSRLPNTVLRQYGRLARRSLTKEEKKLILFQCAQALTGLSSLHLKTQPEDLEEALSELDELRLAGLGIPELSRLSRDESLPPALGRKLGEVALFLSSFQDAIAGRFDDPDDEESHLVRILGDFPFFRDSIVMVDGFWDFTAPQEALLQRFFAQAREVWVTFTAHKKDRELFALPLQAARRCERLAKQVGCPVEDRTPENEPALVLEEEGSALAFLRKNLVSGGKTYPEKPDGIRLVSCKNHWEEGRYLARRIRSLALGGVRWNQIAVLSRGGESEEALALALEESQIPFFREEKKPLADSPLARTLLYAARLAVGDAGEDVVRSFLQYALFDCPDGERYQLEKYADTWSLSGREVLSGKDFIMNPDGYLEKNAEQERELAEINRTRTRIFTPVSQLAMALARGKNEEKVAALVAFLGKIGAEKTVFDKIDDLKREGRYDQAGEEIRCWNTVLERLSGIARTVGQEESDAKGFFSLLTLALSGSLPGAIPPGQDRVLLGKVGFARPEGAEYVFLVDVNTGVFPREEKKTALLTPAERELLADRGVPLSSASREESREFFLFYLAAALARKELNLSFCTGGENGVDIGGLSILGKRVLSLFPGLHVQPFRKEDKPLSREEAFRYWTSHLGEDMPVLRDLEDYFSRIPHLSQRALTLSSGRLFQTQELHLLQEKPYREAQVTLSPSRLEQYTRCPFSYFSRYLLNLKEDQKAQFGKNIVGNFVHGVLENVMRKLSGEKRSLSSLNEKELSAENRRACQEVLSTFMGEENTSQASVLARMVSRSTLLLLKYLQAEFSQSQFQPVFFEKPLLELDGAYRIPLPDGGALCLTGIIDRVDRYQGKDGEEYVRVVDYKTGGHSFSLTDVANGLSLQMLLYLFALWEGGYTLEGKAVRPLPAGVQYLNGVEKTQVCKTREEVEALAEKPFFSLSRAGLLVDEEELLLAQDPRGEGEWIHVAWKKKKASDTLMSLENLGKLKQKVERGLAKKLAALREGDIEALPLSEPGKRERCQYCEHRLICKRNSDRSRPWKAKVTVEELLKEEREV